MLNPCDSQLRSSRRVEPQQPLWLELRERLERGFYPYKKRPSNRVVDTLIGI